VTAESEPAGRLPPRWLIRTARLAHRALYRLTGGRGGRWRPKPGGWGTMRLWTVGRCSGRERSAIPGYFEDGPNLAAMAMNGWTRVRPGAAVDLADGTRTVRARPVDGDERARPWARWAEYDEGLDTFAARRSRPTQVFVLEPRGPGSSADDVRS
jgi:hypothetical protein